MRYASAEGFACRQYELRGGTDGVMGTGQCRWRWRRRSPFIKYGFIDSRPAPCLATTCLDTRVHDRRDGDPRTRDWRERRNFHRGPRGAHSAAAISESRPSRSYRGGRQSNWRPKHRHLSARARRSRCPRRRLRRRHGNMAGQRVVSRRRAPRARRGACDQRELFSTARRRRGARTRLRPRGRRAGVFRRRGDQRWPVAPRVRRRDRRHRTQGRDGHRHLHGRRRHAPRFPSPRRNGPCRCGHVERMRLRGGTVCQSAAASAELHSRCDRAPEARRLATPGPGSS